MLSLFKNISPVYRFLIVFGALSIAWYIVYQFVLKQYTNVDMSVVKLTASATQRLLEMLGHNTFVDGRLIRIAGTSGLWIGDNCNAISLFALFAGFIASFPGNLKSKIWFIPIGILSIFVVNCIRMMILAIMDIYSRSWTEFNHTYTFTIIMYGFIFLLWMYWIKRHSAIAKNKNAV